MNQGFPKQLLQQSVEEKVNYFEKKTVAHPMLINSYKELIGKIDISDKNKILLVYGPSGVGKTTLMKKIKDEFIENFYNDMLEDKGLIPVLTVEAFASEDGKFDWINFYSEALEELDEILIDHKRLPLIDKRNLLHEGGVSVPTSSNEKTKRKLRKALENAIKYRKVKVFLIDEAQHITKVGSSKGIRSHMDTLKSLASMFGIPIIMFGTYELLSFRNLNGQLGRRTIDVHFPRYNAGIQDEKDAFKNVLWVFQKHMPLPEEPDLVSEWKYFYQRTIGCAGTLRDWLYKTLKYSLEQNSDINKLDIKDFQKFEPTLDQAHAMGEEITKGEKQLIQLNKKKQEELNGWLMLDEIEEKEEKKEYNKRPGERKPKRDKTGTDL